MFHAFGFRCFCTFVAMEYALFQGLKTAARPGLKGECLHCGAAVQAKCGTKLVWHWAHLATESCDPWQETETPWHRDWKSLFGEDCSEIAVVKQGVKHIADVINPEGIVFEFQNSPLSATEIAAREAFYGERMLWVVNGKPFRDQFTIYDDDFTRHWKVNLLGDREVADNYAPYIHGLVIEGWQVKQPGISALLEQMEFSWHPDQAMYYRGYAGAGKRVVEAQLNERISTLYHASLGDAALSFPGTFSWTRPRRSWEDARRPVFIDFGGNWLYRVSEGIGKIAGRGLRIPKERFLEKYCYRRAGS